LAPPPRARDAIPQGGRAHHRLNCRTIVHKPIHRGYMPKTYSRKNTCTHICWTYTIGPSLRSFRFVFRQLNHTPPTHFFTRYAARLLNPNPAPNAGFSLFRIDLNCAMFKVSSRFFDMGKIVVLNLPPETCKNSAKDQHNCLYVNQLQRFFPLICSGLCLGYGLGIFAVAGCSGRGANR